MQLSEAGRIVQSVWDGLAQFYRGVESDAFVIMPNHVHGIVVIRATVGAIHESPLPPDPSEPVRIGDRRRMLLSKIVGRFKMVTAKKINATRETPGKPVWQRNYYEHIIRHEASLNRVRQYITNNPARWDFDRENPEVTASERQDEW
jgi:REP element-mobilizing transposase RayT